MKKVEMVEKTTYLCDICGVNITNEYRSICKICGREHCKNCHETVKSSKDMLMGICLICNDAYDKFKKEMDDCYAKYDILYNHDVTEIYNKWKEESLLVKNETEE